MSVRFSFIHSLVVYSVRTMYIRGARELTETDARRRVLFCNFRVSKVMTTLICKSKGDASKDDFELRNNNSRQEI